MPDNIDAILNRPIWHALSGRHKIFSEGADKALCFESDTSPFIASADDTPDSLQAMGKLLADRPERQFFVMQNDPIHLPDNAETVMTDEGVQMIAADQLKQGTDASGISRLDDSFAEDMLALAELTKPGPFLTRTHMLGEFWGIWQDGRLVAMAGERLKIPGMTELSGVCCHPDAQGQGLATKLIHFVCDRIKTRGELPFLHTYASNSGAIRLYEHLGFKLRCSVNLAIIQHST